MINKSNLYVSPLLTTHSLAYSNDSYISEKVAPIVKVKKDSGQIATYGMDNLRISESLRAQGSSTNEVNHSVTIGDHYNLKEHSLKELVAKEEMENADSPIAPKRDAVENLLDRMWVIREKNLADTLSNTSIISQNTTLSGTDQWDDYVNSNPIGDMQTGYAAIKAGSGKVANTIIIAWDTLQVLMQHPDLIARASGAAVVTADVVMNVLKKIFPSITNVYVGEAMYNSGVEGETDDLTEIWSAVFLFAYIEPRPRLKSRTLMATYQNKASRVVDEDLMKNGGEAWDRKGDFVRVTDKYDQKLIDEKCAYLIKDTQ